MLSLVLHTVTAEHTDSLAGWGIKIPQDVWPKYVYIFLKRCVSKATFCSLVDGTGK